MRRVDYTPRDLIILYDSKSVKKKLYDLYKRPFRVSGYKGSYSKLYTLKQLNGTLLLKTYYKDYFKLFKLRQGHLVTRKEAKLKAYFNIRTRKSAKLSSSINKSSRGN